MFKLSSMHLLTMTILVFFTLTKPLQVPIVTPNAKTFHATSKPTTKQLPLIQAEFHDPTHDPTELLSSFTNRRKSLSLLSLSTLSILSAPTPSQASDLKFLTSPLNIRTGATLYDAESLYNLKFITYLTRFLLSFDPSCQRWWYLQAQEIPRGSSKEEVEGIRLGQFAKFSASVEVGLREYRDGSGPSRLMSYMLQRYCPSSMSNVTLESNDGFGTITSVPAAPTTLKEREVREARRQIVLLFSLMQTAQPTDMITTELANIEDARLGEARAKLGVSDRILRIDIEDRGLGYKKVPPVTIAPPISGTGTAAKAQAILFEDNANRGRVERIKLVESGSGYSEDEEIKVKIGEPDGSPVSRDGYQAKAVAIRELEVISIEVTNPGRGYASEKPLSIKVAPPPITARVNINDPLLVKTRGVDGKVSRQVVEQAARGVDGTGGGGGCIGRGCYDAPVEAVGFTRSEVTAGSSFRYDGDGLGKAERVREEVEKRGGNVGNIRATSGGGGSEAPRLPTLGGGGGTTARLLTLFPKGVGLVFDEKKKVYVLTAGPDALESGLVVGGGQGVSPKPLDPDFGPRGRSPVEREKELTPSTYLRFMAAGALCCSTVHLAVTPLDVVKTKVQTNPQEYPNPIVAFKKVMSGGLGTFFTGWDTTFVGFFVWGGIGYTLTEYFRRYLTVALDAPKDGAWEIPIIILSASLGAFSGSFFLCPFETIRIRMVSGGGGGNLLDVGGKIVKENGVSALFNAVPAFLLKEIPFAAAKFAVFDASTERLYEAFPAAREDLRLSLAVSLTGGCLGGIVAAFVSNPADAVISELKKVKNITPEAKAPPEAGGGGAEAEDGTLTSAAPPGDAPKMTIRMAYDTLYSAYGLGGLFRGISIRIPFYCLVVSLQFFLYDSIRVLLGVGRDDLNLFLDVLGGALGELKGDIM
ncbi:hypothetical protein TrRE_jg7146 [Triparma retinervis]|uniref:Uncharacterized protein n=1 Tax=Triparma retinervis TaxID=2557542 RepID=A0A9W7G8H2_9STRA|nr:hypothetical protein TrRE_jg7146 [Triparma retinervis]